jgi:hypothetical protein
MQSSFGPTLRPFAFLQLLAMVIEVWVDLGTPTCEPPCKQMLVGMGRASWPSSSPPHFLTHPSTLRAGARSGSGSGGGSPSPIIPPPHCRSTHQPLHEQLLVRLEGRGASSCRRVWVKGGSGGVGDVAHVEGSGAAYHVCMPLPGSPGIAHRPPVPK